MSGADTLDCCAVDVVSIWGAKLSGLFEFCSTKEVATRLCQAPSTENRLASACDSLGRGMQRQQ